MVSTLVDAAAPEATQGDSIPPESGDARAFDEASVLDGSIHDAVSSSDAAGVLARLLDLRGSVELARALSARVIPSYVTDDPEMPKRIGASVRAELGAIRSYTVRTMSRWTGERARLPNAASVHSILAQSGVLERRTPRSIAQVTESIWSPFASEASNELTSVVRQVRALRKEIGPDLVALGPDAARVERLDALLAAATEEKIDARLLRLVPAAKAPFEQALGAAIEALGSQAQVADVLPWFEARGPVRGAIASLETIVLAALDFEAQRIYSLVNAAVALFGHDAARGDA